MYSLCRKGIIQFVPDPFDDGNDLPFIDPSDLLPDVADVRVDGAGMIQVLRAPGESGDILPRMDLSHGAHHQIKNEEFRLCQCDLQFAVDDDEPFGIDRQAVDGDAFHDVDGRMVH